MKTVTDAYKTQIAQPLRNRSHVLVTLEDINYAARDDATVTTDANYYVPGGGADNSFLLRHPVYRNSTITTEHNRWLLDGNQNQQFLNDNTTQMGNFVLNGYVSDDTSDNYGEFDIPPWVQCEFGQSYTLTAFSVRFDTRFNEWPYEVYVKYYLNGSIIKTEVVTGLTGPELIIDEVVTCDKVLIQGKSGIPGRRFRVERVILGAFRQFDGNTLVSSSQSTDVDPLSRWLPKETMSFTIMDFARQYDPENPQGIWELLAEKAPIIIQHGFEIAQNGESSIEWLDPNYYVLSSRPEVSNYRATFSAGGMLASMTGRYYKDTASTGKSLYFMAIDVLTDSGIVGADGNTSPWVVDESLRTMYTDGILPIDTHANCLQIIAHAARCLLYTGTDGKIHIEPFTPPSILEDPTYTLGFDSIYENGESTYKISKLKDVSVARYKPPSSLGDSTVLYETETDETTLHIELSQPAKYVSISVTGTGTLTTSSVYARAIDLTMSAGTKTIQVTGKAFDFEKTVRTYTIGSDGDSDEEDNPLITSSSMQTALANHVATWLSYRTTYNIDYRGDPALEVGDYIGVQTRYADSMPAMIITNELYYNGSISGGMLVKGLSA